MKYLAAIASVLVLVVGRGASANDRVVYAGKEGPGRGKQIVFLAGDEEYRSEEGMPMLARILAVHHGSKCTVLFPLNPADGTIDPNNQTNIAVLETSTSADLMGMQLPADVRVLVYGQVLAGMRPTDKPLPGSKNDPMMPLIWIRDYTGEGGKTSRIICSTIGAAVDLESEGLRRLFVNAIYWGLGMDDKIEARSNVAFVGEYHPTFFGFAKFQRGLKPADFA